MTARFADARGVTIALVTGDEGVLPLDPEKNTAGIAAAATLAKAGIATGVALTLHKGMPIGSGLGSSAASAAAAAYAVNLLIGSPLRKAELVGPEVKAELKLPERPEVKLDVKLSKK